ncbi:MAG: secretin and TonB N-terminal domain-containing protein [Deltaproteobacteria bacterium]|nr:secretin and TonB N-terminal domain-containing protein [Deltaproteobacteria bacterium]
MKIPALFLACLFFAAGCTTAARTVREGDKFAAAGSWDEAVLNYTEAFKKDPRNLEYRMKYLTAKVEAARIHFARGADYLSRANHEAALLEFKAAFLLDPTFRKAEEALKKAQNQIDSLYHYGRGIEFLKDRKEAEARRSFKRALKLDPDNASAAAELEKFKKEAGAGVVIDGYELDLKSALPITLEFKDAGVKTVFGVLAKLSGVNFVFDSDVRDAKTSVYLKDSTFKEALDLLLTTNNLSKKVVGRNAVIIYPSTPNKLRQYEEMVVKVFYLTNIEAQKAVNLIRTMVRAKDLYVHAERNAIVVRAKPESIELARKILEATDLADAEVILAVDVMEVSRRKGLELGISPPSSATVSIPQEDVSGDITGILLKNLGHLSSADLIATIPSAVLNMKVEDGDVEILANPRIRVKNNEKARIHIGDRVPIITTTVLSNQQTQETVQYQDVGLKLSVEPNIRPNDEVDLKLNLEVSSLGKGTVTNNLSTVYEIGTRNVETTLRLYDGETQIIGGLISDRERTTVAKIPGLGEIPVLGKLFSSTKKENDKTDILLSITPHIVRKVEIPDDDVTRIWSGSEESPAAGGSIMEMEAPPDEGLTPPEPPSAGGGVETGADESQSAPPPSPPPVPGIQPVPQEGTQPAILPPEGAPAEPPLP